MVKVFAPAKVNLSLHVTGQRADGLHLLDSLVCFVDVGDWVTVEKANATTLTMDGPGAEALKGEADNLVLKAARLFPDTCTTKITLEKDIPIAAGLGGGSADAAATLIAMSKLWELPCPDATAQLSLGADVPVCVQGKSVRMQGIGETLENFPELPQLFMVLVNSGAPVSTAAVFTALKPKENPTMSAHPVDFKDVAHFADWLRDQRNDLQESASQISGDVAKIPEILGRSDPLINRMSGSGGTCFALFADKEQAARCATKIQDAHPKWWVRQGRVLP